jgi:hypothetical protein
MKLVKENINFERGLDPKKSMKIGMPMEAKFKHIVDVCKRFDLDLYWEAQPSGDYEIMRDDSRHHKTVFASFNPVTEEFDTWKTPKTKSVDQAIKNILLLEYEDIDEEIEKLEKKLINIKKIKEYCSR